MGTGRTPTGKAHVKAVAQTVEDVLIGKYNENHDERGRFSTGEGGVKVLWPEGKLNQGRRSARTLDTDDFAQKLGERAIKEGHIITAVRHGGGVANSYGYPSTTTAVSAVAFPSGHVVASASEIPANKVTQARAAAKIPGLWDYFSGSTNDETKAYGRERAIQWAAEHKARAENA